MNYRKGIANSRKVAPMPDKECSLCHLMKDGGSGADIGYQRWGCFDCLQARMARNQVRNREGNGRFSKG